MFKFIYYSICLVLASILLFYVINSCFSTIFVVLLGISGFFLGKRFGIATGGWGDNAGWLFALLFMAVGALLHRNYFTTF